MRITCSIKLLLLSWIFISQANAQTSPLQTTSDYYVDTNSQCNLQQIQTLSNVAFLPFAENENIKLGYNTNKAIWCRINITNSTQAAIEKWLVFDNIYLDSVMLFVDGKTWLRGDRTSDIGAYTIAPSFPITIEANSTAYLIVRLKKGISYLEFRYQLVDQYVLLNKFNHQMVFYTFVLGLITLFFLFNLILYFVSKRTLYVRYSVYVFMIIVYLSIASGFAKFYLFPWFLFFSELRIYTSFISYSAFMLFVMHYMDLRNKSKGIYQILRISNYLNWFILATSFIFYLLNLTGLIKITAITNYLNLVISLLVLIIGLILNIKKQRNKALYSLSVFSIVIIWSFLFILKETTQLDFNLKVDWLFISNIYEVVLFGILLAIEYYQTFIKNQNLMMEVIEEKEKSIQAFSQGEIIERKRLANTLHDNFGSRLSAIKLFLGQQSQQKVKEELETLSNDIRNLSHQIMPRALQEGAFSAALQKHIDIQNEANSTLKIEMFSFDMPEKMEQTWIFDLYLISQEVINNTVKYANATSLTIELFGYENEFIFQYTDNGQGFDQNIHKISSGLDNIDFRIKKYGGTVEINSKKGEGTHIIVQMPR